MLALAFQDTLKTLMMPYFLRMLLLSVVLTLVGFVLFAGGVAAAVHLLHIGHTSFANAFLEGAASLLSLVIAWTLFPIIVPLIGVVFLENVATHIDRHEYRAEKIAGLPISGELWHACKFVIVTLLLNIACLPVYLIATVFAPFVYYTLNGYLIGREFFELAAARHIGRRSAVRLRKLHAGSVFLGGAGILFLSNLPLLNLFAPFIGAALMVHLFRRLEPGRAMTAISPPVAL